jgi:hypothetical protein
VLLQVPTLLKKNNKLFWCLSAFSFLLYVVYGGSVVAILQEQMNQLENGYKLELFHFSCWQTLQQKRQHESATSTYSTALQVVKHIKYIDMATLEMTGMNVNIMPLRSIP